MTKNIISDRIKIFLCVALVIGLIILVIFLTKSDNYVHANHHNCGTCQGLGNKICVDRPELHSLYENGILTETSNLVKSKQWPITMPEDQFTDSGEREHLPEWSKSF
jgi:hypothetical protein